MFMLPSASTTPRHLEPALNQLEKFIGIRRGGSRPPPRNPHRRDPSQEAH
jgi:hypothetical protein